MANLTRVDLTGKDLRGTDFGRAKLHNTNLSGSDLRGADFWRTNLTLTNLSGADLSEARLEGASRICTSRNALSSPPGLRKERKQTNEAGQEDKRRG